jgi:hypothetical protein
MILRDSSINSPAVFGACNSFSCFESTPILPFANDYINTPEAKQAYKSSNPVNRQWIKPNGGHALSL